jgi:hypothetical protein
VPRSRQELPGEEPTAGQWIVPESRWGWAMADRGAGGGSVQLFLNGNCHGYCKSGREAAMLSPAGVGGCPPPVTAPRAMSRCVWMRSLLGNCPTHPPTSSLFPPIFCRRGGGLGSGRSVGWRFSLGSSWGMNISNSKVIQLSKFWLQRVLMSGLWVWNASID